MLGRGAARRCARCGSGGLFRRYFTMIADCPGCGYHFEREEGFFLGAYTINIVATELMVLVLIIVGFATTLPDPPLGKLIGIGLVLSVLFPIVGYPFSKTLWTAIDQVLHRTMGDSFSKSGDRQPGFRG